MTAWPGQTTSAAASVSRCRNLRTDGRQTIHFPINFGPVHSVPYRDLASCRYIQARYCGYGWFCCWYSGMGAWDSYAG